MHAQKHTPNFRDGHLAINQQTGIFSPFSKNSAPTMLPCS